MILFRGLTKNFVKDGTSLFQNILVNFHKFHTLLSTRLSQLGWDIITSFAKIVPKMLTGAQKVQRMASALTFLEQCHKNGDEFFSHIV
jgi:hypothetical protein